MFIYTNALQYLNRDYWLNTGLLWMLVDPSYVASRDDVFVSAAASAELTGVGYGAGFGGAGRLAVAGKTFTLDSPNNRWTLGATSPQWPGINAGTAHALIALEPKTSDADSLLIAYVDAQADKLTDGDDLTYVLAGGLVGALVAS